jgi:hypothetical protein
MPVSEDQRSPSLRHYHRNKDRILANKKAKYTTEIRFATHLKRAYGITIEKYNEMFEMQGGRCLICGRHQDELDKRLRVDHDHETGEVRGLLCHNCNVLIGHAREDKQTLVHALSYLNIFHLWREIKNVT